MSDSSDVLIIGGGVAGLAAAGILGQAGLTVTLLEARHRLGGRIITVSTPSGPVELGAEFIHGEPPPSLERARKYSLELAERYGSSWCMNQHLHPCNFEEEPYEYLSALTHYNGPDISFTEYLERFPPRSLEVRASVVRFVEGFNAADKEKIGVHFLIQEQKSSDEIDGDRLLTFKNGYGALVAAMCKDLARDVRVHLNEPVRELRWSKDAVTAISTNQAEYSAKRAVITVPVSLLKGPHKLRFSPELPAKEAAAEPIIMGSALRITFEFRDRFWASSTNTRPAMPDLSFLLSEHEEVFPVWWTQHPTRNTLLTGWVGGPTAMRLARFSERELSAMAMNSLCRIFGDTLQDQLVATHYHDWQADPWSLGAYSYVATGGMDAPLALAKPVEETLFFAGEATNSEGRSATVDGAITTGERAAKEVLDSLR